MKYVTGEGLLLLIGDDWAEDHHGVEVQDETGRKLAAANLAEGVAGVAKLHELVARHGGEDLDPADVVVGIETDRGSWAQALTASGYQVFAINPRQVNRFKERYGSSGAKSDKGDAHALADMVRIGRGQLRPVAGDSEAAQAVKGVARAHQTLIWERTRTFQRLRTTLREYFPAALDAYADLALTSTDALELLIKAATPQPGRGWPASRSPLSWPAIAATTGTRKRPPSRVRCVSGSSACPSRSPPLTRPPPPLTPG